MLLPCPLYNSLRHHFATHRCWHVSRFPGQEELRKKFAPECGGQLHGLNEPGSGCDFLHYHRRMIRHFKWVIDHTAGVTYVYRPWPGRYLPSWLEELLRAAGFDVGSAYIRIDALIQSGTLDDLGGFVEANALHSGQPGAGVHNHVHRVIADWEQSLNPVDDGAGMADMGTAPANAFFWMLHGWIDELYAEWQRGHGEPVEQSPLEMQEPMVECAGGLPSLPL